MSVFTAILLSHEHSHVEEKKVFMQAAVEHRCLQGAPAMRGRERHLRGAEGGGEGRWKVIFYADKYCTGEVGGWNSLVGRPLGGKVEESQHTSLYNLPVVPDGATQHHAEDHPYDLKINTHCHPRHSVYTVGFILFECDISV